MTAVANVRTWRQLMEGSLAMISGYSKEGDPSFINAESTPDHVLCDVGFQVGRWRLIVDPFIA